MKWIHLFLSVLIICSLLVFLNILIKNKIREFDSVLNNDSLKIIISSSYSLKSKKGRKTYEILNYFNNLFKADKKHKFKKI